MSRRQAEILAAAPSPDSVEDPSTRDCTLPIGRSDPGPIARAGVVSLWAPGRPGGRLTPGVEADDPGVPNVSLADEKPPRHRYAKRPLGWVEEGPLHPCLVTDVGTVILRAEPGGHTIGTVPVLAGALGRTLLGPTPGFREVLGRSPSPPADRMRSGPVVTATSPQSS